MKSFLQFVTEVLLYPSIKNSQDLPDIHQYLGKSLNDIKNSRYNEHNLVKSEKLENGDHVLHFNGNKGRKLYTVMKDGKTTMALTTTKKGAAEAIDSLAKHSDNTLPAHELYHHLITKNDKILTSDRQSTGGLRVWQKLAKTSGVNIHGWDNEKNKPVNIDKHLKDEDETHIPKQIHDYDFDENHGHLENLALVAHKK